MAALWSHSRDGPSWARLSTLKLAMETQTSAARFVLAWPEVPVEKPHWSHDMLKLYLFSLVAFQFYIYRSEELSFL